MPAQTRSFLEALDEVSDAVESGAGLPAVARAAGRALDASVIVLDSGSTDDTVARARALGARVVETDWPGHVAQKNRALDEARGDWVLSLDADERVTTELRAAIVAAMGAPTADGFRVARRNHWLGHRLTHGHWYPDRRVRLARRSRARWRTARRTCTAATGCRAAATAARRSR